MKCNMMSRRLQEEEEDSDREIWELKQKIRLRRQQIRTRKRTSNDDQSSSKTPTLKSAKMVNIACAAVLLDMHTQF